MIERSCSAFLEPLFSAPNHGAGRRYSGDITDQPQLVEHVLENLIQRATEVVGPESWSRDPTEVHHVQLRPAGK